MDREETQPLRDGVDIGVLLVNLGSPDSPTPGALRRYLKEFLGDPRLVDMPRPLWWLILNGIILNVRPRRSARLYAEIWTDEGAPLITTTKRQARALEEELEQQGIGVPVVAAMRYGNPSIREGLETLRARGVGRIVVLPLYPQYSSTTTASVFDALAEAFRLWRSIPEVRMIRSFGEHPGYITALADSVRKVWQEGGEPERLLMSFHGLPARYVETGDTYADECAATAGLLARELGLDNDRWQVVYQSRFGREEWLRPYADDTLRSLAGNGVAEVDVICPGFPADCLETREEIGIRNKSLFLTEGGKRFRYIPALNESPAFVGVLADLVRREIRGWSG